MTPPHGFLSQKTRSSLTVWGAVNAQADLYRTLDGGNTWGIAAQGLAGAEDFDDVLFKIIAIMFATANKKSLHGIRK